ncbi:hypothetical protein ACJMK2_012211 [Sinanodonta woodiana]|uniref:Mab-21-like HhH/H2TH-like domain-containing protein n=1 Tax=Sinanodonta woodiana TaxID=1069815 RepID=A0ABD3V7G8_SINWO
MNVDDMENVLTSYYCKTCMFYLIRNTPAFLWHPNNLMLCLDLCLKQLLSWVQCGNCPNYFVPNENMFLGKLEGPVQREIASILQELLRHNGRYLTKIHYDNIGVNLVRVYQSLHIEVQSADEKIIAQTIAYLLSVLNAFCFFSSYFNIWKISLFKSQYGPRKKIDNVVRSLVCSAAGIYLASQSLKPETYNQEKRIVAHKLLLWGSTSDVASGKLKLATFYLALGNLETMEEVLNQVVASFTDIVCEEGYTFYSTLSKMLHEDLSTAKFIQNYVAFKVCYNNSDIHIIPKVLIYEIFKSTGSELDVDVFKSRVFPIAEVQALIYLYFLQYQCFHLQGRVLQTCVALNNMTWVCNDYFAKATEILKSLTIIFDRQVVHTEIPERLKVLTTSLNLMAYCLKQNRRLMDAFKVFCASMKLTNQNNGAKWQIATFINYAFSLL